MCGVGRDRRSGGGGSGRGELAGLLVLVFLKTWLDVGAPRSVVLVPGVSALGAPRTASAATTCSFDSHRRHGTAPLTTGSVSAHSRARPHIGSRRAERDRGPPSRKRAPEASWAKAAASSRASRNGSHGDASISACYL